MAFDQKNVKKKSPGSREAFKMGGPLRDGRIVPIGATKKKEIAEGILLFHFNSEWGYSQEELESVGLGWTD